MSRGETDRLGGFDPPLRQLDDGIGGSDAEGVRGADQEQCVTGYGESRNPLGGFGRAHLRVSDSDELLLVAVIDFDVPAPEVGLNHVLRGGGEIGRDQVRRLAVQKPRVCGATVGKRSDDDQPKQSVRPCFSPQQRCDFFDVALVNAAGAEDRDGLPWNRFILTDLLGCERGSIRGWPSCSTGLSG